MHELSSTKECAACQRKQIECVYPRDERRTAVRSRKTDVRALQKQLEVLQERLDHSAANTSMVDRPRSESIRESSQPGGSSAIVSTYSVCPNEQEKHRTPSPASIDDGPQVYGATSLLHDHSTPLANRPVENLATQYLSPEMVQDQLVSYAAIRRQEELTLVLVPSVRMNVDFDGVPVDLAMHLLELHWNRQHLSYLLTYRPAIMHSLMTNGPFVNKLLLNAIYLQSSLYSDRESSFLAPQAPNSKGLVFYERFKQLLPHYIDAPSLPTVVALLTSGACLVPYGRQSAGWALSGMGYQMIIDLGCHLECPVTSKASAIEQEMKKRIYWGAFVSDKFQSLFLGRPPVMRETGDVSRVFMDSYEEMEEWKPYIGPLDPSASTLQTYQGRPSYAISTFQALLQLCMIAGDVVDAFYSVKSSSESESVLLQTKHRMTQRLGQWQDNLPAWLRFEPGLDATRPPHQLTPHALYWALVILIEQAFLRHGHFNFNLPPDSAEESRQRCIEAALKIWKLVEAYKQTFTLRRAQYGISYASYCAVLVMLQHTRHDDDDVKCIRFFWSALWEYQKGCSYSLKRPLKFLKALMQRLEGAANSLETEERADLPTVGANLANDVGIWPLEIEPWDSSLLGALPDDPLLADESIFGMFGG
ncbi:hypothetical protein BO78DRAFT_435188 [Aspergillus sclerotiicarbonarius CBS 121057]|uniref:Xylanolytic transcriptional activator regulatory domain-containing protein n=1 Tax=Aspergillus sclerotiicarbonarius (strain CBS 121057 / IBT 28362) TaxID=1448318 RepID=A0A319EW14_ASPSB|nr:hypothetical protein BO78DRAFT_435188 [Aspergillus sclerotiicarbonarius CBS 121057]